MIVVFIVVGLFLRYTRWGREIYAIGGGRNEARAAGVPVLRPMIIAFTCSGALAGLGGALLSIRLGSATPLGFDSLLLSAATTCLMGGIALEGGIGNVIGIAIGLFTLRFLVTGMAALGAPYYVQNLAVGALADPGRSCSALGDAAAKTRGAHAAVGPRRLRRKY